MGVQPNNLPQMPEKLRDFRTFLVMVWRHLNLPDPTPIQLDFANYLQSGPRRTVNEAFRGVGKSWIAAAFVVWKLRINPNLKFMILSASKDRADNFTTFCLRLITEIPILQCLMPKADQRCSKLSFDVGPAKADHAPSVTSKGIFSQITGGRADIIIADDIEVPGNSFTQAMRDKLSEAVKEFDAILKPGGVIIYLGTPRQSRAFTIPYLIVVMQCVFGPPDTPPLINLPTMALGGWLLTFLSDYKPILILLVAPLTPEGSLMMTCWSVSFPTDVLGFSFSSCWIHAFRMLNATP